MRISLALAALAVSVAGVVSGPPATQATTPDLPIWTTRPCLHEDSVNCRWIATGPHARGNGRGHTFVVRRLPGSHLTCVFYAERVYARTHDNCFR